MPAPQNRTHHEVPPRSYAPVAGVSMRDLLAAGAAADAISTPPRLPDPGTAGAPAGIEHGQRHGHREAA
ncbi:hypothetical protein ACHBTE_05745 [Streptomyces sp. M41]|uniref:hypothetical protein n=1 Tax=Streptomyces sp. M41 TaxID=3059412 RepID=UPI00374D2337